VRELTRGGRRKNDVIDASAAASVAALQGDAQVVDADAHGLGVQIDASAGSVLVV
jgi:hypothetical protein